MSKKKTQPDIVRDHPWSKKTFIGPDFLQLQYPSTVTGRNQTWQNVTRTISDELYEALKDSFQVGWHEPLSMWIGALEWLTDTLFLSRLALLWPGACTNSGYVDGKEIRKPKGPWTTVRLSTAIIHEDVNPNKSFPGNWLYICWFQCQNWLEESKNWHTSRIVFMRVLTYC